MTMQDSAALGVRFTVPLLKDVVFIRYPIGFAPPEGTIGFVNDATWQTAGIFRNGQWCSTNGRPFKRKPTHFTVFEDCPVAPGAFGGS